MGAENEPPRRVAWLRDLGVMEHVPVGTNMYVEEDGVTYISVGQTTAKIRMVAGWPPATIWMPDHVHRYLLRARGGIFPDPVGLASALLLNPSTVHRDLLRDNVTYFFINGAPLRDIGLLHSTSVRYVDAAVELRHVLGGSVLRLFHLSPRSKNQGGEQLWP